MGNRLLQRGSFDTKETVVANDFLSPVGCEGGAYGRGVRKTCNFIESFLDRRLASSRLHRGWPEQDLGFSIPV